MKTFETYVPTPRQKIFHEVAPYNPKLIKAAIGGLTGGKTTACEQEQSYICQRTPGGKSIALRQVLSDSEMTLIDDYKRLLAGHAKWSASKSRFTYDNGHKLIVTPANRWDRFGSAELVSFYIQEAQEVDWKIFDALTQRLRGNDGIVDGIPFFRGYFDARGVKKTHWIYKDFVCKAWNVDHPERMRNQAGKNPDWVYVKFTSYDNPHATPGYVDGLVRDHASNIPWKKMMIEGEFGFDIEGRPVFECYDPDFHNATIVDDPSLPILRGVDFGYNHPAVVWCQYTRDGRLLVLREFCPESMARHELVREVEALQRSWWPNRHESSYRDFGDIAGEQQNSTGVNDIEFWENHFSTSIESRKARISEGLNVIRKLMTSTKKIGGAIVPLFQVDPECERLCEALGGAYYYEIDKKEDREVPVGKGYRDVADALRYVAQLVAEEDPNASETYSTGGGAFASY